MVTSVQATFPTHSNNINDAVKYMKKMPNDVAIITSDNEETMTNKCLLSVLSPSLGDLLSSLSNFSYTLIIKHIKM